MLNIKNFTVLTTIILLFLLSACLKQKTVEPDIIRIGVSGQMPPYSYYDSKSNQVIGFDVDIANEIARRLNKKCQIHTLEFSRLIPAVISKQIDFGMGSMNIVEARQNVVNFTIPYNYSQGQFVAQKSEKEIKTIEDIKTFNIIVGMRNGTVYRTILSKELGFKEDQLKTFPSQRDLSLALQLNMVQVAISDYAAMYHLKEKEGIDLKFIGKAVNKTPCGITVHKNNEKLLQRLNKALTEIVEDGTYDHIAKKWFGLNPLN
jgi:ABC-type amino acid transport substrate-binding protein